MTTYNQVRKWLASKGCGMMGTKDLIINIRQKGARPKGMHTNKGEPT